MTGLTGQTQRWPIQLKGGIYDRFDWSNSKVAYTTGLTGQT